MKIKYDENPKLLNDFLNYLLNSRGYSINTVKAYCLDLLLFFKFIKDYFDLGIEIKEFNYFTFLQINESDVLAFLVHLGTRDNSPYSRQRRLSSIRSFYKWLYTYYPIESSRINPTKNIPNIKKVDRIPKYLNLEQSKKLIDIFNTSNSQYSIRDNMIVYLLLVTGLRVSELINININDIDFFDKSIQVIGKGNKQRKVFINDITRDRLLKYLKFQNKSLDSVNEPLFLNKRNQRIGIDCVENICEKAYKLAGLEEYGYTVHTLRHTAAMLLYQYSDVDILVIKEILGHKSITSTQVYIKAYNEKIRETFEKNPLSKVA